MLNVIYEDKDIIVAVKPPGVEAQSARKFAPDMVSEIKKHLVINKECTPGQEPYVGVIHRLDKPVSGIMVYGKTKKATAALSAQVQNHEMQKIYGAVVCGKPVNSVDNYVDYLMKTVDGNYSQVVDKGITGAKRAELSFEAVETVETEAGKPLTLVRIHLKTGRHHQIRVQFSHHGLPLLGDAKYNPQGEAAPLALCAVSLSFRHPSTGKPLAFSMTSPGEAFKKFSMTNNLGKPAHTMECTKEVQNRKQVSPWESRKRN